MSTREPLILVFASGGFGNKVFDLIFCLYLYQKYNEKVRISFRATGHNKPGEPSMDDVFPKLKPYIDVISEKEMNYLIDKFKARPFWKISRRLENLPPSLRFPLLLRTPYQFVSDMYEQLQPKYRETFQVSPSIISNNVKKIGESEYIAIHIRYGDKLCLAQYSDFTMDFFGHSGYRFPVYSPAFYTYIIDFLRQKSKIPIYIFTDTTSLVEDYVLSKINNKKGIEILDTTVYEAFYLMKRAYILVMGTSTLAMAAAYMNPTRNIYYVKRPSENKEHPRVKADILQEEMAVQSNWHMLDNIEYVLNYNQALLQKMTNALGDKCQKYREWWEKTFIGTKSIPGIPSNFEDLKAIDLPPYSYEKAAAALRTHFAYAETDYFEKLQKEVKSSWKVLDQPDQLDMAREYLLFSQHHRLCFLVNPTDTDLKSIRATIEKDTKLIAYHKINGNRFLLHNILLQYVLMTYGAYAARFRILEELESKYAGREIDIHVFLFNTRGKGFVLPQIAHVTNNFYFTYLLGSGLFHKKSLEIYSRFRFDISFRDSFNCFRRLNTFFALMIEKMGTLDIKRYIIFSSILLAITGLRACDDADVILSFGKKEKEAAKFVKFEEMIEAEQPGIDLKSVLTTPKHFRLEEDGFMSYIRWAKTTGASSMDDMILNPKYHWYFMGVKMVDIPFEINKKAERPYPKAILDMILFKMFFDHTIKLPPLGTYDYFMSIIKKMETFGERQRPPRYIDTRRHEVNWRLFFEGIKRYMDRILTPHTQKLKGPIYRMLKETYPEFTPLDI